MTTSNKTPKQTKPKFYSETRYIMQSTDVLYTIAIKDDVYKCDNYVSYPQENVMVTFDLKKNKPVIIWCAKLFGISKSSEFIEWVKNISDVCVDMSYGENDDKQEVWAK